nr:ABC transporter permease [uncultured Roseibium sp.]
MKAFVFSSAKAAVGLVICIALWALLVRTLNIEHYMLPGPERVWSAFASKPGFFLHHAGITAYETVLGLVLGVLAGAFSAILLWTFPVTRPALLPLILVTQSLPVFAIAPILVLWLGWGLASKIVMAVLVIFFAVTSTMYDGLRRMDPGLVDLARLYRLPRHSELWMLRLPAALPALASGIRIAAVFAPIGAIVGEWVGAKGGLAFVMLHSNARVKTDETFAALILLAVMVLLLRAAADAFARMIVPWQVEN